MNTEHTGGPWVYIHSETSDGIRLYTVGFYDPSGKWVPEFDGPKNDCAARCAYLNGGNGAAAPELVEALDSAPEWPDDGDPYNEDAARAMHEAWTEWLVSARAALAKAKGAV